MRAIQLTQFGGPEAMELVELPIPEAGEGEVLIAVRRAGINFSDTHQRENQYVKRYELPLVPGGEVAGVVEHSACGFKAGQRVIAMTGSGGYAQYVAAPASGTFALPDDVEDGPALALLIQGLTAWHLYRTSAQLRRGESVVVHSAAGGVGSIAVQLARPFGAGRVIATASTEPKRELSLKLGADAAIDPEVQELGRALREANRGEPVDVVLEMAGGRIFDESLAVLAPFGRLVTYGLASRQKSQLSNSTLFRRSQGVVGFWLMHCLEREGMLREPLADLFARAARGELCPIVGGTYSLSDVRRAHEDIQGRRTTGKLLLDPAR